MPDRYRYGNYICRVATINRFREFRSPGRNSGSHGRGCSRLRVTIAEMHSTQAVCFLLTLACSSLRF